MRGDGMSEQRFSEHSTSGWKAKMIKEAPLYSPKTGAFLRLSEMLA
jgi:hypothetical protein